MLALSVLIKSSGGLKAYNFSLSIKLEFTIHMDEGAHLSTIITKRIKDHQKEMLKTEDIWTIENKKFFFKLLTITYKLILKNMIYLSKEKLK